MAVKSLANDGIRAPDGQSEAGVVLRELSSPFDIKSISDAPVNICVATWQHEHLSMQVIVTRMNSATCLQKDNAQTPQISRKPIRLPRVELWTHVRRSSNLLSIVDHALAVAQLHRKPEVNVLDRLLARGIDCDEQIIRLDVAMNHQHRMDVLKATCKVDDPLVTLCDVSGGDADGLGEGSFRAELHKHEKEAI